MLKIHSNKELKYIAFFDVDETIINKKSMFDFLDFFLCSSHYIKLLGKLKYIFLCSKFNKMVKNGVNRTLINTEYYKLYKNKEVKMIEQYGKKWHLNRLKLDKNFYNKKILDEICFHKDNGGGIVLVSGSFNACLKPIAQYVEADFVIGTNLQIIDDKYTGNINSPQIIGEGKELAIKNFLKDIDFSDLKNCYAYADHITDLAMLKIVGNPVVVSTCEKLRQYAKENRWKIL